VDLSNAGILNVAFKVPHRYLLPDAIAEECGGPTTDELVEAGAVIVSLTEQHIALVADYSGRFKGPSRKDLFALSYSKIEGHLLLTSDKPLRSAAESERVPVHGVLWLLDELVSASVLSGAEAIVALNKMRDTGSWLPVNECEIRIRRWSK
jgi:hypothetical protein